MVVWRHKQDKNLIICSQCAKEHITDLFEYEEYPYGECSICGSIDEQSREEYMWWSHKLDTEMRDWEDC